MPNELRLTVERDSDGTCELFAEVSSDGFSGAGSAWFGNDQLVDFARQLVAAYPLPAAVPLGIEGGFWIKAGTGIEQLHVGLKF